MDAVAFSPDGTKLATACQDKTARMWDAATGKPCGAPMEHGAAVIAVAFSPDGTKNCHRQQRQDGATVGRGNGQTIVLAE